MAERSCDVLESIRGLQVVALQEAIGSWGTLGPIADLIVVEVDGLQTHNGVVLIHPDINPDD